MATNLPRRELRNIIDDTPRQRAFVPIQELRSAMAGLLDSDDPLADELKAARTEAGDRFETPTR